MLEIAHSAKLNGRDPFAVMVEIFKRLPEAHTIDDFETLTNLLLCEQKVPLGRDLKTFPLPKNSTMRLTILVA